MARALARGFVAAGLVSPAQLLAHDPAEDATRQFASDVPGSRIARDNQSVVVESDVVIVAVKPQVIWAVLAEIAGALAADKLLVSIAAGVSLETLCERAGTQRVVRVMPNTPCLVGRGAAAFALAPAASASDGEVVRQLFGSVGLAFQLDESLLDAVTGLSGSGPAFVYTMIEALSDGGVRMGLPRAVANALAAQTVLGAAQMVLSSGEHPAVLRDRVASPGGTTIAGLHALENHGVRSAMLAAVQAATERSRELGQKVHHD